MHNERLIGTFAPNHKEPIHSWYPYIEGYSSALVETEFEKLPSNSVEAVYDPFGGTGTTPLVACLRGIDAFYSETNPFMRQVVETKTTVVRTVASNPTAMRLLQDSLLMFENMAPNSSIEPIWDGFEKYFDEQKLIELLSIKEMAKSIPNDDVRALVMLAISAIVVPASKMIRRGDLRFAKGAELDKKPLLVKPVFLAKLSNIIDDIDRLGKQISGKTACLAPDARDTTQSNVADIAITSPPYLNGTNYIRNTKLELKLNDYILTEGDLSELHSKGIVAGINNVSKRTTNTTPKALPGLDSIMDALNESAYDQRIPKMVSCYFRDMDAVIDRLSHVLRKGSLFVMDIGDSQFAGVHVPTHELLATIASEYGFVLEENEILRVRRSKNGMELSQRIMRFTLDK